MKTATLLAALLLSSTAACSQAKAAEDRDPAIRALIEMVQKLTARTSALEQQVNQLQAALSAQSYYSPPEYTCTTDRYKIGGVWTTKQNCH